jgi:hypothetical protein
MRKRSTTYQRLAAASALLVVTALGTSAGPANAAAAWVCPQGSVCFYYDGAGTKLACQTPSNGNPGCDGAWIWGIYNRGYVQPNSDHAYVSGYYVGSEIYNTGCVHVGHKGQLKKAIKPNWVVWSGECGQFDDDWVI